MAYDSNQEEAKNYTQKIGLGAAPWTHTPLSALADHEVNLVMIRSGEDPSEPIVTVPVENGSRKAPTTVEHQQPITVTTPPTPQAPTAKSAIKIDAKQPLLAPRALTPKTADKMDSKQLMKAFLSGEITKQEYDTRRKALK